MSIPQPAFVVRVLSIIGVLGGGGGGRQQHAFHTVTFGKNICLSYSGASIQSVAFVSEIHDWYHGLRPIGLVSSMPILS